MEQAKSEVSSVSDGSLWILFQHQTRPCLTLVFCHQLLHRFYGAVVRTPVKDQNHVVRRREGLIEKTREARLDERCFVQDRNDRCQQRTPLRIHGGG